MTNGVSVETFTHVLWILRSSIWGYVLFREENDSNLGRAIIINDCVEFDPVVFLSVLRLV